MYCTYLPNRAVGFPSQPSSAKKASHPQAFPRERVAGGCGDQYPVFIFEVPSPGPPQTQHFGSFTRLSCSVSPPRLDTKSVTVPLALAYVLQARHDYRFRPRTPSASYSSRVICATEPSYLGKQYDVVRYRVQSEKVRYTQPRFSAPFLPRLWCHGFELKNMRQCLLGQSRVPVVIVLSYAPTSIPCW